MDYNTVYSALQKAEKRIEKLEKQLEQYGHFNKKVKEVKDGSGDKQNKSKSGRK